MGGGDLNLKKSWHPNTMKNQERVWKAEQADAAEKNKLAELQREISDERDREELKRVGQMSGVLSAPDANKKLEWMYKSGDNLNREEYLLGRTIDRNFERADAEEKEKLVGVQVHKNHVEHECIPFSIRSYHGIQMSDEQVDLQRKIMEDPLMAIRQREMETRKKLLENPVKLKEIHRLLRNDTDLDEKSTKGKDKKSSKKRKKDKKAKKSSKNVSNDLDEILAKKYRKIRGDAMDDQDDGNLDIDKFLALKYNQLSNELDKMGGKTSKSKSKSTKTSKDDSEKKDKIMNHRHRDKQYDDRGTPEQDRTSLTRSKNEIKSNTYMDGNRYQSPDRSRRNRNFSPVRRGQRSRSRSTSRRDSHRSQNYSRHSDRSIREPNRRSPDERHKRIRSRTPDDRHKRIRSRTPDDRHKRIRSRTPDDRHKRIRSRTPDDRHKRIRSRTPDQRQKRISSRTPDHRQKRIRSRTPDHNIKKSKYQSDARRSRSKSRNDERPSYKPEKLPQLPVESKKPISSRSSSSSSSNSSSSSDSSTEQQQPRKNYGLVSADGKQIELKNKYKRVEKTDNQKSTANKYNKNQTKTQRISLTEEEKAQKLKEMQENAKLRVVECQQTMERNKKEKFAEEEQLNQTFDKDYINKQMRKAIAIQGSVESRIKSNMNNIQRSGRTMEANFARR